MQLWQLTQDLAFDGEGGLAKPGRWHTRARVLYCAESAAGALLEARVHLYAHPRRLPAGYRFDPCGNVEKHRAPATCAGAL